MPTILAIDVGTVRVGCAVADDKVGIPFPVAVWPRARGKAEREVLRTLNERGSSILVVGLPLGPNGERTAMCDVAQDFVRRIQKRSSARIVYVDESFSSLDAHEKGNFSTERHETLDAIAACQILENYFALSRQGLITE